MFPTLDSYTLTKVYENVVYSMVNNIKKSDTKKQSHNSSIHNFSRELHSNLKMQEKIIIAIWGTISDISKKPQFSWHLYQKCPISVI